MANKMVYYFGKSKTEGKGKSKALLGGKGLNLAEMTSIGLPVPPGFTITTEVCDQYYKAGEELPDGLMDDVNKAVKKLEKELGKKFGDDANPLLVSVRSGAAVSMPGMMNTILNLGLNDVATEGLAKATKNERFAYDAYRRLINMFGTSSWAWTIINSKRPSTRSKRSTRSRTTREVPCRRDSRQLCEAYKGRLPEAHRRGVPPGSGQAVGTGNPGRVWVLDDGASGQVSRDRRHSQSAWNRCQRSVDGLWQYGR